MSTSVYLYFTFFTIITQGYDLYQGTKKYTFYFDWWQGCGIFFAIKHNLFVFILLKDLQNWGWSDAPSCSPMRLGLVGYAILLAHVATGSRKEPDELATGSRAFFALREEGHTQRVFAKRKFRAFFALREATWG
jgi:hypothetical protein